MGLNIEASDPRALLTFWSEILGVPIHAIDDVATAVEHAVEPIATVAVVPAPGRRAGDARPRRAPVLPLHLMSG